MLRDDNELVERIYDTVEDLDALPDVLSLLCDRIGGRNAVFHVLSRKPGPVPFVSLYRVDPRATQTWSERHVDNLWARHMLAHPVCVPVAGDSFAPLDRMRRTGFYGEVLEPLDIAHGALFKTNDGPSSLVGFSIHRSADQGPFTRSELARTQRFLPHIRRAVQLRSVLERSQATERIALGALDQLTSAVLLVGRGGRVLFANASVSRLAAARDAIVLEDGTVRARHRAQNHLLLGLIASALNGGPGGALPLARESGRLPLSVLVSPLKGILASILAADARGSVAAIFLIDPERQAGPSVETLRALYGFTPTEARVALEIVKAGSIGTAALALKVAPETVRTHVKRIYAKTGVNRRSALVRLLAAADVLQPSPLMPHRALDES
ncbi:MAG: helix-turn-helix transcriptional regulator [Alphaproteobacteria bacterium]|nr:helix-turn-helix transcriptional regulator [Alphaproteobacteria bacterium]MCW5741331.1 helix-turn-helix transcriptional regulator [Alphaproteobacteria bacterium]